jgi:uncharacterized protein Yka (UPF0111/DUF47 family)
VKRRWFLPEVPDVLGMLRGQLHTTEDALLAFAAWAHGDAARADDVRALEHEADDQKRALWRVLRRAFVTPVDAEDLFVMSAELDEIVNGAKDTVREAEVLGIPPDAALAEMADLLLEGARHLGEAFVALDAESEDATGAADSAVKSVRAIERVYRRAMSSLLAHDEPASGDLREVLGRRELYGRAVAISERMRIVGERVWYTVVKEA